MNHLRESEIQDDFNICALLLCLLTQSQVFKPGEEKDGLILAVLFLPSLYRKCKGEVPRPLHACYLEMGFIFDEKGVLDLASTSAQQVASIQAMAPLYMEMLLRISSAPEPELMQWLKKEPALAAAKIISRNNEVIITPSEKIGGILKHLKKWGLECKEIQVNGVLSFSLDIQVCQQMLLMKFSDLLLQIFEGQCEFFSDVEGNGLKVSFFDLYAQQTFLHRNPKLSKAVRIIEDTTDNFSSTLTLSLMEVFSLLNSGPRKDFKLVETMAPSFAAGANIEMKKLNSHIPKSDTQRNARVQGTHSHMQPLRLVLLSIIRENSVGATWLNLEEDDLFLGMIRRDADKVKKSLAQLGLEDPKENLSLLGESVVLEYFKIHVDRLIEKWILRPMRAYLLNFSPDIWVTPKMQIIVSFQDIQIENMIRLMDQHPILASKQNTDEDFVTRLTLDADAIKALLPSARAQELNSADPALNWGSITL